MWNDNETDVDLLGFGYLVDSLDILLSTEDLLPLTVGVFGDWGSGKSSLMRIAQGRLEERSRITGTAEGGASGEKAGGASVDETENACEEPGGRFICVAFSPWRFEDYAQVKLALMTAVIEQIADHIRDLPEEALPKKRLARVRTLFSQLRRLTPLVAPAATVGAALAGLPPEGVPLVAGGAQVLTGLASDAAAPAGVGEQAPPDPGEFESIAEFHVAFEHLVASLADVQAVVVFIDDMDRCTTRAIVDTFEAIRLFLHAPKTAYVLGLNEPIITAALEERYPGRTDADESRGQHYLEKVIQTSVAIPPLSEPEVRAYVTFLYSQRHVDESEYAQLRAAADRNRAENPNGEILNAGIARGALGLDELPVALSDDVEIAAQISGPLARGLRGNPRQIKRFLTTLELRRRVAARRDLDLDPAVLAKLMVLEVTSLSDFELLYQWQADHDGVPPQLRRAEEHARDIKPIPDTETGALEAREWATQTRVQDWLRTDPRLADVPLSAYYTFSRDRITITVGAARLSPEQQALLAQLDSDVRAVRERAVTAAVGLDARDLADVVGVLIEQLQISTNAHAAHSLVEIAGQHASTATTLFNELQSLPARKATRPLALWLKSNLGSDPRTDERLAAWAPGNQAIARVAGLFKSKGSS